MLRLNRNGTTENLLNIGFVTAVLCVCVCVCVCETWSLTWREERRLMVSENSA